MLCSLCYHRHVFNPKPMNGKMSAIQNWINVGRGSFSNEHDLFENYPRITVVTAQEVSFVAVVCSVLMTFSRKDHRLWRHPQRKGQVISVDNSYPNEYGLLCWCYNMCSYSAENTALLIVNGLMLLKLHETAECECEEVTSTVADHVTAGVFCWCSLVPLWLFELGTTLFYLIVNFYV